MVINIRLLKSKKLHCRKYYNNKGEKKMDMKNMKSGIAGFLSKKMYGKKMKKGKKDNEKDNGKKETKAHEKAESKKFEEKE
jgi:hypothetical protein